MSTSPTLASPPSTPKRLGALRLFPNTSPWSPSTYMTEYGPTNSGLQQRPPPLDTDFHQGRTGKSSHALSSPTRLDPFHSLCASSSLRSPTKNSRPFFRPRGQQTRVHPSVILLPSSAAAGEVRGYISKHTYGLVEYPYQMESSPRVLFTVWFRSLGLMWHMLCTVYICAMQNSDIPYFTIMGLFRGQESISADIGLGSLKYTSSPISFHNVPPNERPHPSRTATYTLQETMQVHSAGCP
jgi:hypothetical protein